MNPTSPAARTVPSTRWADDPQLAALAWSRLTETADETAQRVCFHLGVQTAVDHVLTGHPLPLCALDDASHGRCRPTREPRKQDQLVAALERWRGRLATVDPARDLDRAHRAQARLVVPGDPDWPTDLDALHARRPVLLWVRGSLPTAPGVALVGSRSCTGYGRRAAAELAAGVAERGYNVVSGAALGIDACAHRGALAAGSTTTAVLACGIDRAYPTTHSDLLDTIAEHGAVVSESPPGSTPTRWRFLERNRIIAGLGRATVVVEAALRSGALNTATHTRDLLRPLGAVPGPITSATSAGCHELIRKDATCITGADDIHELAGPMGTALAPPRHGPSRPYDGLDPEDLRVWEVLSPRRGLTVPQIAVGAGVSQQQARVVLGRLSSDGMAVRGTGQDGVVTWRRARSG